MASEPKVLLVGCGGIGGIAAAGLARAGGDVTVVTGNPEISRANCFTHGVRVRDLDGKRVVAALVSDGGEGWGLVQPWSLRSVLGGDEADDAEGCAKRSAAAADLVGADSVYAKMVCARVARCVGGGRSLSGGLWLVLVRRC